jgi:hypothetical protein
MVVEADTVKAPPIKTSVPEVHLLNNVDLVVILP